MNTGFLQHPHLQRLLHKLPTIINVLLVVMVAYTLSQWTWLLLAEPPAASANAAKTPLVIPVKQDAKQQNLAEAIAKQSLFGQVDASAPQEAVISAPETKLNLKLTGILATGGTDGLAMIASGSNEEMYKVGTKVPGNATLKQVLEDRVILQSSRGLETLKLPVDKDEAAVYEYQAPDMGSEQYYPPENYQDNYQYEEPPPPPPEPEPLDERLQSYRQQFIRNPASLGELAEVQPVQNEDGSFVGYRLNPKSNNELFSALGIQQNDVITEVNGIELNQPAKGLNALRKLMNARELNLTIQRNGQEVVIQHGFGR